MAHGETAVDLSEIHHSDTTMHLTLQGHRGKKKKKSICLILVALFFFLLHVQKVLKFMIKGEARSLKQKY